MQHKSQASDDLDHRFEKQFGAAGRRRKFFVLSIAGLIFASIVGGMTYSMLYVGKLNAHIPGVFASTSAEGQTPVEEQTSSEEQPNETQPEESDE